MFKWTQQIFIGSTLVKEIERENQLGETRLEKVLKPDLSGFTTVKKVFTEHGWLCT